MIDWILFSRDNQFWKALVNQLQKLALGACISITKFSELMPKTSQHRMNNETLTI
jgi:hypothetical protein